MKTPTRVLTIEDFNPNGHFVKDSQASLVRLKGCWLKDAGFPAGTKVIIKTISPGVIELRVCSPVPVDASCAHAIKQFNDFLNENPPSTGTAGPL